MVATSPGVANARVLLDDEGLDAEDGQARSEHQAVLTAAHNEHSRVLVFELLLLVALVEPVVGRSVQAVLGAQRTTVTGELFVTLDLPERRLCRR